MDKKHNIVLLAGFIILAFLIKEVAFLSIFKSFFGWYETFFHEMSHGLASIFTGGKIASIELAWNGSGLCYSGGGIATLVTFAGYFGASLWGALMYNLSSNENKNVSYISLAVLTIFMLFTFIYVGNITTFIILLLISATIFLLWFFRKKVWSTLVAQFIGVYVMIHSVFSPLFLFSYSDSGDHISMMKHTGISSTFWIYLWVVLCGTVCIWTIYRRAKKSW